MAQICPTVMPTIDDPHAFRGLMERVGVLAPRIQIDLMDGVFAPHRNIEPSAVWWPDGTEADIHVMYKHPASIVDTLIALHPHMIILHVEADDDILSLMGKIKSAGILAGVALLTGTAVESVRPFIEQADHVLLFAGQLGVHASANLATLDKVAAVRAIHPSMEIGWDGGANETDAMLLKNGGIDVINVGGYLERAENPKAVYEQLVELVR